MITISNRIKNILAMLATTMTASIPAYSEVTPTVLREPTVYSPQTSEMIRYDYTQVNQSTGCINLNIPLVSFQDKDFDYPVSISYNSAGFRPRDPDNYVGRNWMLNAGGVVYRTVSGIPDDLAYRIEEPGGSHYVNGFRTMLGRNYFNQKTMKQEVANTPYKYVHREDASISISTLTSTSGNNRIECSPDVFYFSFGKHSGKFMINYDGSVSVMGYDGGKYEVDLSNLQLLESTNCRNTCIRIKTDDGYVYTFGGDGYASLEYNALSWSGFYNPSPGAQTNRNEITAFHLTEIKAPNGRKMTFHYRDIDNAFHLNSHEVGLRELNNPGLSREELYPQYLLSGKSTQISTHVAPSTNQMINPPMKPLQYGHYSLTKIALIERIETDRCTIRFHYSKREQHIVFPELTNGSHFFDRCGAKLDSVELIMGNNSQKARLSYTYQWGNRMFLSSLQTTREGYHRFEYNAPGSTTPPSPMTYNIDHWEFWRGRNENNGILPGMNSKGENSVDYTITTNDRDATGIDCESTLLNRIIYPTGGSARFSYEPNIYSRIPEQNQYSQYYLRLGYPPRKKSDIAGGARIKSIRYLDATGKALKETAYTYGYDLFEGELMYRPYYKYLEIRRETATSDTYIIAGVSFNSEGFSDVPYPSVHIRYPQVTEHYLDPDKGDLAQKHAYKTTDFHSYLQDSYLYTGNSFFYTSEHAPGYPQGIYVLPYDYMNYCKHLLAHPTADLAIRYGKIDKESFYDENKVLQKTISYHYKYQNMNDYSLRIFTPVSALQLQLSIFSHIGRESFRSYVLTGKQTAICHNSKQQEIQEYFIHDAHGYLTEHSTLKSNGDSLITTYSYETLPTNFGMQVLPAKEAYYLGTASGRKMMQVDSTAYRYQAFSLPIPTRWRLPACRYQFAADGQLATQQSYTRYDRYGNLIEMVKDQRKYTVYLWGYYGQHLVARIENATYEQVKDALGTEPESLSELYATTSSIDTLREKLPAALVYTYTYRPGVGMDSETSPNGQVTGYKYDEKGRLSHTYRIGQNGKREFTQLNEYHIINE